VDFATATMEETAPDSATAWSQITSRPKAPPTKPKPTLRQKVLFVKVRLPVDKKPMDPTSAGRLKLKELWEVMLTLDPTTVLYKY
jgi:hypothetical protein